jgi:uncharacterized protein (TIGR00299 family) protein
MRIAYIDCFAGISGDMFLGALLEAGVPLGVMQEATTALGLNAGLRVETVDRSGIRCTKVYVLEDERLAEASEAIPHQPATGSAHEHAIHKHATNEHAIHEHAAQAQGKHRRVHGRSLSVIRALIQGAALAEPVKALALRAFELLGSAEAKIHNVPVEQIHFHEVGAVDAIVDIVAASAGIQYLQIGAWHSSALNVGGGMVVCAHGTFPVPAPATAELLRGLPTYSAHVQKELVTPTGAALLRALGATFGPQPAMRVEVIGYGAGTRNPVGFPNVLRVSVGDADGGVTGAWASETVTVLETALDDLSPQLLAYVAETALAQGALDVMLTPVMMKKGRPGTLLTVLCEPSQRAALTELILRETTTLGVRTRQEERSVLDRTFVHVETAYGPVRIKIGSRAGEVWNAAPEFEDCRAAAERHAMAVKVVQQAAVAAYRAGVV